MSLFKKPEDPWDIDPSKGKKPPAREPIESPLDTLKSWNEKRRADAEARQAELDALPREKCPWCGEEMERGYVICGKGHILWYPGFYTTRAAWIGPPKEARARRLQVDSEGALATFQTAWVCHACKKMVLDTSNMYESDAPAWPEDGETPEEETPQDGEEETT